MSRERIIAEVVTERQCQEVVYGDEVDDTHSVNDWVAILARQTGLATDNGGVRHDRARFRRQMVRIAAVALAALESLARYEKQEFCPPHASGPGY